MSNRHPITIVPFGDDPLTALAERLLSEHGDRLPLLEGVVVLLPEPEAASQLRQRLLEGAELLPLKVGDQEIWVRLDLSERQRRMLAGGGALNMAREG